MRKSFAKLLDVVEEDDIFHHVQTKGQDIQQKTLFGWLSTLSEKRKTGFNANKKSLLLSLPVYEHSIVRFVSSVGRACDC
jgi:hypothetical protein